MTDRDSFVDEVTEELRRDQFFGTVRRYAWVGLLAVFAIVGGTAWTSYQRGAAEQAAQAFGDGVLAALDAEAPAERADALKALTPSTPGGAAARDMLAAAALTEAGDAEAAKSLYDAVSANADVPMIYRDIAMFHALTLDAEAPLSDRRSGFETLATPGNTLRLLAQEQLALLDIEEGAADAAIERLQTIITDAETTTDLQQRATGLILVLGGSPNVASFASE